MKKLLLSIGIASLFCASPILSQQLQDKGAIVPMSIENSIIIPTIKYLSPNLEALLAEDVTREKNGELYRIGVPIFTNITTVNSGIWSTTLNGDRVWQLKIKVTGAEALSFIFSNFKLYGSSNFKVTDKNGSLLHKVVNKSDMLEDFQQHLALCFGDEMTLTLTEPQGTIPSEIQMDRVMYNYRSTGNPNVLKINESASCEVNINCTPVGDNWQDEKRGVARIYVVDASGAGWCSGSLVNNTAQDCKPLLLTALHCGVSTSAANSNLWKFYFKYEAVGCTNPGSAGTLDDYFITGCVRRASSVDGGGTSGSDFLLVQMGTLANEAATITTLKTANFNAYWIGWDANNVSVTGGAGIHHPAGDIKKISTFTGATVSTGWNGNGLQSHWRFTWTANANGYGVTEGGSSGSPLFNNLGRQIGTLTGGGSFCNAQTAQDMYGKMSYHWVTNGTPANEQLKTYLDPGNTGALVLDGSPNPCSAPTAPVANFSGTPTTVAPGGTVAFTDLSTGIPNVWSWTITPGTAGVDWSYTGGTTSASQNPQVIFNTIGQYNVSLYVSNGNGNDTQTNPLYITVAVTTGPCAAISTTCDEFISNVTLNTINNTSTCLNYADYTAISTTLNIGSQYTATITPMIGAAAGAYTDDELAIWIDWNNDDDFNDVGERVGYVIVAAGWSNQFTFTVPASATIGTLNMRVRMSYLTDDGAIVPCGTSQWGEVEDYSVVVQAMVSASLSLTCGGNQTIVSSSGGSVVPNVLPTATANTTCPGGTVTGFQTPAAGTALSNGANLITVTATDQCGNTQTCQVTVTFVNDLNVSELNLFSAVTLFPNPVSENLVIDLSSVSSEEVTIELFDMTGKLLAKSNNFNGPMISIDMTAISNGLYQVKLSSKTAQTIKQIAKM